MTRERRSGSAIVYGASAVSSLLAVDIHYTQWEDQHGTKRYGCEIIADTVGFLTKGRGTSVESAPDID